MILCNCSLMEWSALFISVIRYPVLFCTTGTHDWPQLGSLNEWDKLKTGFYGNSCPSSSLLDTSPSEAEKSLMPRGIVFSVWIHLHRSVCVLMCVVGIESRPGLICSHHGAQAAGVPVHLQSEHAPSYLGKMLSTRVGLPQGSTDIWATPGMSLPIKGQHLAIFISAIKQAAVRGKKGSKCEKRLANDGREGRSWAGISAPAGASSAANATILTQKMMTPCVMFISPLAIATNGDP